MNLFKRLVITFSTIILTTGLLLSIGHIFTIPILMFHYEYISNSSGLFITSGSILPLAFGIIVGYITEKIYVYKISQKIG